MGNKSGSMKAGIKGIMNHKSLVAWIAIVAIVVIALTAGKFWSSSEANNDVPIGTYVINDVEYLAPFSSETKASFLKNNLGSVFEFYDDQFFYTTTDAIEWKSFVDVIYKETPLGKVLELTNGVNESINLSEFAQMKAYRIFSKNIDTGYTMYHLDEEVWLAYMNPGSELQDTEYLFSLQRDELQNQSASEILSILTAKNYPITEVTSIYEENDPGGFVNTANGYIGKVGWIDSRGIEPERCHVSLEVYNDSKDCELRKNSMQKLYSYISSDGYYFFSEGRVLVVVQNGITQNQAAVYGEALQAIKRGQLSEYKAGE
jgi:hypothetical protein